MERETGIEPATNSLEGCDSTTELLPPSRRAVFASRRYGGASPPSIANDSACRITNPPPRFALRRTSRPLLTNHLACQPKLALRPMRAKAGGEGRVRTSVATRAAGLQPAAIDRSATSPNLFVVPPAFAR